MLAALIQRKEHPMNKLDEEAVQVIDLGDAKIETRQASPTPPNYPDGIFGFGSEPDRDWP